MTTDQEDDGIISRWSQRKRGVAMEAEQAEELSVEEQKEIEDALEVEHQENRQAAEEIDLDTIDEESDLSVFMKAGVPEALKKQALAVLWRSNPVFANVDGLNDYDDDFGSSDLIMKTFKSAYQAGRGYLQKEPEPEDEVLSAELLDEDDDSDEGLVEDLEDETDEKEVEAASLSEDILQEEELPINADFEEEVEEASTSKISLRQRLMQES